MPTTSLSLVQFGRPLGPRVDLGCRLTRELISHWLLNHAVTRRRAYKCARALWTRTWERQSFFRWTRKHLSVLGLWMCDVLLETEISDDGEAEDVREMVKLFSTAFQYERSSIRLIYGD